MKLQAGPLFTPGLIAAVTFLLITSHNSIAQSIDWFDPQHLDCTVLLEKRVENQYVPHGTGFLLYSYQKDKNYTLITCEHVLRNKEIYVTVEADSAIIEELSQQGVNKLILQNAVWTLEGNFFRTRIELIENVTFVKHDYLDIAAIPLNMASGVSKLSGSDTIAIKVSRVKGIPKSQIKQKNQIRLGEDVYFLGFPFMIGTYTGYQIPTAYGALQTGDYQEPIYNPVLRSGIVGWKSNNHKKFLLDALSYGGNSGSPIFTKVKLEAGLKISPPHLIGMVIGHLGEEANIELPKSNTPDEKTVPVVKPIGNSGLAICLWIDDILEVVDKAEKLQR
jgi:hypothetical protein